MKTTLSQMMKTAALLGLFALLCANGALAGDFAERSAVTPGFQLKVVSFAPGSPDLVKPGDGISIDPLAASLREVLTAAGEVPGQAAKLAILTTPTPLAQTPLSQINAPTLGTEMGTPAKTSQDTLTQIQNTVDHMPDLGKASGGDAATAGQTLSNAVTGERTSGSGEVNAAPEAAAPEVPLQQQIHEGKAVVDKIKGEVGKVIVGQHDMINAIIMTMIARQHVLLEGLPGVAKTETAKAFSDAVEGAFQRVQGTSDKLPSDILGTEVLQEDPATGKKFWELSKGPIFTNILLVDEINRMPPKAQASLLEAMAEGRVTIGRQTVDLMRFTVLATQNPVEQDGTYRLPEAQLDRFMFKALVPQPNAAELKVIMERNRSKDTRPRASKVTNLAELDKIRRTAEQIPMDPQIEDYIVKVVMAAKEHSDLKGSVEYSVYTRAAIFMAQASRIHALMEGRDWVSPADVRAVAPLVMRHRIVLNYQASGTTPDQIIEKILDLVAPPKVVAKK